MLTFLYVLHFLVCFILIGVVLLQRGKGQDIGASLGGGSANTIFGSRGAGNFLTRITTASAVIFMLTSLSLSYLGYKSSDARLFDESEPFVPEGAAVPKPAESGLEEIPDASGGAAAEVPAADAAAATEDEAQGASGEAGGLVEIQAAPSTPAPADTAPADSAPGASEAPASATPQADAEAEAAAPSDPPADAAATPTKP